MKIELKEPFKSKWKFGVLQTHKDGRKRVCLYGENFVGNTIISYARYLMTVKLGYFISDELVVDHKDNDKTNDSIENLQLLTWSENSKKEHQRYRDEVQIKHKLTCACCKKNFIIIDRIKKMKIAQNVTDWFCSKSCSTKYHYHNGSYSIAKNINEKDISLIKELQSKGHTGYSIAKITGISANTCRKYMKLNSK